MPSIIRENLQKPFDPFLVAVGSDVCGYLPVVVSIQSHCSNLKILLVCRKTLSDSAIMLAVDDLHTTIPPKLFPADFSFTSRALAAGIFCFKLTLYRFRTQIAADYCLPIFVNR